MAQKHLPEEWKHGDIFWNREMEMRHTHTHTEGICMYVFLCIVFMYTIGSLSFVAFFLLSTKFKIVHLFVKYTWQAGIGYKWGKTKASRKQHICVRASEMCLLGCIGFETKDPLYQFFLFLSFLFENVNEGSCLLGCIASHVSYFFRVII